jgi:xanthine/uracil permease
MTALLRQEMALATTEVGRNVGQAGRSIGVLAMGGLVAYAGLLAIVAAVIILLAHMIEWWLAAFLVGIVVAGIGYVLVRRALNALQQIDFTPRQTVATLKEDLEWAKDQTT